MTRSIPTIWLLAALFVATGCTHAMKVKNLDEYRLANTHGPRHAVAVRPFEGKVEDAPFFEHVVDALRAHPSVGQLRTGWTETAREPGFEPDIVLRIEPSSEYSGSGWNLPITFPGFLLAAPGWHGLVYHGDLVTRVEVLGDEGTALFAEEVPTRYSMRHLDGDRGFWAYTGWWLPGYGATSLISGIYNISYDDDATRPFTDTVRRPYGEYIAELAMQEGIRIAREERRHGADLASGARREGAGGL